MIVGTSMDEHSLRSQVAIGSESTDDGPVYHALSVHLVELS